MTFWLIAVVAALFVMALILWPILRADKTSSAEQLSADIQIYRDQLSEVESDLAKGVLSEEEAERTRIEVSRRILDADKAGSEQETSVASGRKISFGLAIVAVLVVLGGTGYFYNQIGARGLPDFPRSKRLAEMSADRAARPPQAEAEANVGDDPAMLERAQPEYQALVAQLRETVAKRPDDLRGLELLADHEARLGRFAAARIAKGQAIELKGAAATASDYTDYAELMIIAAGGYVSPIAENALGQAIRLDRRHSRARYYSGLDLAQNGRPDLALQIWTDLLAEGPPEAPWIEPIRNQIGDVARLAGEAAPNLPGNVPGPDAQQIQDAADMTDEERQELIRTMVNRLSERLATGGGNASEWARLIRALGVLGETDRAQKIYDESQTVFSSDRIALRDLLDAAQAAGVAE
jgi:cytochrome c-type biogenesis protein CcmH